MEYFRSKTFFYILALVLLSVVLVFNSCSKKPTSSSSDNSKSIEKDENGSEEKEKDLPAPAKQKEVKAINKPAPKPLKVAEQIQFLKEKSKWVDSVFNTLTPDERIAQLIMFDAYAFKGRSHTDTLLKLVKEQKIGGLIFLKGSPGRQVRMINELQAASNVPLLIAMDAEYGIGMRLDSATKYPFQMTLGAIQNDSLIYEMGKAIADDVKRVGMHVNFAPVLDINNNVKNPVIGIRSFGENKHLVTRKSLAYMRGLQDHKVLATAKHFPGHGDTDVDSHYDLPLISASKERLDTLELYPFRELIKEGIGGVMIAHMNVPALDNTPKLPSTLSKPIVTGLLKEQLGFKGLIFTDAMVMEGVAKYYPSGVAEPMAVISGNDVLEKMKNARVAIQSIRKAIEKGDISQQEIDERCRKILAVKEWTGLNKYSPISYENLHSDLKNARTDALMTNLIRASATLLSNHEESIPVKDKALKIATLSLNSTSKTSFQEFIGEGIAADHFFLSLKSSAATINKTKQSLAKYDLVILGIYDRRSWPMYKLNYSSDMMNFLDQMMLSEKSIVTLFGNAYALNGFKNLSSAKSILVMYENSLYTEKVAAEILLGQTIPNGKLPVTINDTFKYGNGITKQ